MLLKLLLLVAVVAAQVSVRMQHRPHKFTPADHDEVIFASGGYRMGRSVPISGGFLTLGAYFVNISLGAANEEMECLVDTGSSNLAVPAQGCTNCGDGPLYFPGYAFAKEVPYTSTECQLCNPTEPDGACIFGEPYAYPGSSGQCGFGITYGGGSSALSGIISIDQIALDCMVSVGMFGQIQNQIIFTGSLGDPGHFYGIMGLASIENACNPTCVPTVMDLWYSTNQIQNNTFGICISPQGGGVVDFGAYVDTRHIGPLQWVPNPTPTWFTVNVLDVQLAGTSLGLPPFMYATTNDVIGTFVDSGTSIIIMGPAIFTYFQSLFQNAWSSLPYVTGKKNLFNGNCFSGIDPSQYPTISVLVEGMESATVTLDISPYSYLMPVGDQFCLGIAPTASIGMVLGDVFMQGYYIAHDRETRMMGFAPVNPTGGCSDPYETA